MDITYNYFLSQGVCPLCGNDYVQKGHKACSLCLYIKREKVKLLRMERRENGLCVYCGKKLSTDKNIVCDACCKKQKLYHQKRIQRLKENNLCIACGKEPAVKGKLRCTRCLIKSTESTLKSRKKKNVYKIS